MSNTNAKRDDNFQPVMMAETDDANRETSPLVSDPVTKRLKTTSTISDSVLPTGAATSDNQTNGSQKTQLVETLPTDSTKLNPSVSITEVTVGTVTTKTIQKTIGTDVYQKTVAIDSSDNSINISTWSKL